MVINWPARTFPSSETTFDIIDFSMFPIRKLLTHINIYLNIF